MTKRLTTYAALQEFLGEQDDILGFVPTMGALHDGHIRLIDEARAQSDRVLVSIFVNPKQFAPHEDLAKYPRQIEQDVARLESAGADAVYIPDGSEFYPDGFNTKISVGDITASLEGVFRPQFFDGVTTVVGKLFFEIMPDKAFFGEKDFQQLQTVRKMVGDLRLPIEIIGVPTLRDQNSGLALSSRNAYLNAEQLKIAEQLNRVLLTMADKIELDDKIEDIEVWARAELLVRGFDKVDYCDICDAENLGPVTDRARPRRILAAAWIGTTRLIDNIAG